MNITRLPWATAPKHDYGVWYRIQSADGNFIGTCRGKHNAQLLQNAPTTLHLLEHAMAYLNDAADAGCQTADRLYRECVEHVKHVKEPK